MIAIASVLGVFFRIQFLSYVQVTSDSLSPFVGAIKAMDLGYLYPANPESDQWLWILALPFVWVSNSLTEIFLLKCISSVIVVPIGMWVVGQMVTKRRWLWMLGVGVLLAVDVGLIDTMVSSFRGYWAPECIAIALIGWVYWERGHFWGAIWGTTWLTIAMGQHPLVIGCFPVLIALWLQMKHRKNTWLVALGVCLLLSVPRFCWLWYLSQCDAGGLQCLVDVAGSSSEQQTINQILWRVLYDRLWVEMGIASPILVVGCCISSNTNFRRGTVISLVGIAVLGLCVSTLRPYHFRVLIVPLFILALQGWSEQGRVGVGVLCFWIVVALWTRLYPIDWYSTIDTYDDVAGLLCEQRNPVWIEGYGKDLTVMPQGIGVSMRQQGCPVEIASSPTSELWILTSPSASKRFKDGEPYDFKEVQLFHLDINKIQRVASEPWWSGYDVAILSHPEQKVQIAW